MGVFLYGSIGATLNGLLVGSLYGLMGLGLALIYRVTRIPNFAYAEYITYGGYAAAFAASLATGSLGVMLAGLAAIALAAVIALVSDELGFKPLWKRGASSLHLLVASIGIGLVLRYGLLGIVVLFFGTKYLEVATPQRSTTLISIGGIASLTTAHILAIASTIVFAILLWLMFTRTRTGKAMRATASNPILARISGINIFLVRRITWLIAGALAGFSGFVYAYYNVVNPESGWLMLLYIFAAATMGGFTFLGTMISGIILGLAEYYTSFIGDYFIGGVSQYSPIIALITLFLVLLFKPQGVIRMEAFAVRRA
ncbi:branched-chain amino acid ABC transporter permease [Pyrofollis japonicus]|uniref:branched-chain amino acid ABC transporter permease n=1 Tax=Pyrofollis japonicus TaxID=3060460 RepID=UPI00295A730E|nr:branched-chain amino acid ABC transporter permease [Pyrofollis japonicus]BEP18288.1 branched-chain amino acid ABC transporter permease [Pyrofollis japonicus]